MTTVQTTRAPVARPPIHPPSLLRASSTIVWRNLIHIRRMPEITHAFTSFVENAVDFAASEVLVTARFDADTVSMEVRDDGPGFAPEILAKLGELAFANRPSRRTTASDWRRCWIR